MSAPEAATAVGASGGVTVRPMTDGDLGAAARLSAAAFAFDVSDPATAARWRRRLAQPLATDPAGSFIAERDGHVLGVAQAIVRERLWILALLTVAADAQGSGAGRALMAAALGHRDDGHPPTDTPEHGLIVSSNDPRALGLYASSGFALRPTLQALGVIDHAALPPGPRPGVRQVGPEAVEALAAISRAVRGAAHTVELLEALDEGYVLLRAGDRGFALAGHGHAPWLLVARDEEAARELLVGAMATGVELAPGEQTSVRWITGEQDWAIPILVAAGLRLSAYGALAVRAPLGPLRPYLPSGAYA